MSVHWVSNLRELKRVPREDYMNWGNCTQHFPWVLSQLSAFCHSVTSWARDDCSIFSSFQWISLMGNSPVEPQETISIHSSLMRSLAAHPHLFVLVIFYQFILFLVKYFFGSDFFKVSGSWAVQVYVIPHILGFFDWIMKSMVSLLRISIPSLCPRSPKLL